MKDVIERIAAGLPEPLSDNDRRFLERVFATDGEVYRDRLRAIGYEGLGRVLDAGCGFGQWSLALADLNREVVAVDFSENRVEVVRALARERSLANVTAQRASVTDLPFEPGSFDAVFCYGVIFCTPYRETLRQFRYLLRPGGRLYFTANAVGFLAYLWLERPNPAEDYDPRDVAALSLRNTLEYERHGVAPERGQIVLEPEEFERAVVGEGFEILARDGEGRISLRPGEVTPRPFFRSHYHGLPCCYEILAQRR